MKLISWAVGTVLLLIIALLVYSSLTNPAADAYATVAREWPKMEACSGIYHPMASRIRVVTTSNSDNGALDPMFTESYHSDTLFLPKNWRDSVFLVRHGIGHALLTPIGGHPKWMFNGKCGDLMHGRPTT